MSLRSGVSHWQTVDLPPISARTLADDVSCEVVVLGAGVTGALVAHQLIQEGVDVILVDKRDLGTGSTAASTGLLQYEIDTPLSDLIGKVGKDDAVHAYARGLKAIDEIERLTEQLGDRCGFSRRETIYFASHFWHRRQLEREFECRRQHGFDVELLERSDLARLCSIKAAAAVRSRGDAQIDPYRFTQRLLHRAGTLGGRMFSQTEVLEIRDSGEGVILRTGTGNISARRIVFATGYDSYRYLPKNLGALHSTYAMASEPMDNFDGWPDNSLVWETARPYFYARLTDDGRAVVGGEDTAFSADHQVDTLVERKAARLTKRFRRLFPRLDFKPQTVWSGVFGESKDGLAYIGQSPDQPNAYFAIGYGGNGITFSMIAAGLITDLYLRRPNADAEVFRFDR